MAHFYRTISHFEELDLEKFTGSKLQFIRLNRLLNSTVVEFVKQIFNYDKLQVSLLGPQFQNETFNFFSGDSVSKSSGLLNKNDHCSFIYEIQFKEIAYRLVIDNIPCLISNKPIELFLDILGEYIHRALLTLMAIFSNSNSPANPSREAMYITDHLRLNIAKSVLLEYLFTIFNEVDENYIRRTANSPPSLKYDMQIIEKAWSFTHELAGLRLENEEICCGFIFQIHGSHIENNSVRSVKLEQPLPFGVFQALKNLLKTSNGQDIFLNVTKGYVTDIVLTKNKVKDISLSPVGGEKNFSGRPLIVSVQGAGRIFFIEGGTEKNSLLFQIVNNSPVIRDGEFIRRLLRSYVQKHTSSNKISNFVDWILSLGPKRKGTSVIILKGDANVLSRSAIKYFKIRYSEDVFFDANDRGYDFSLLDHFTLIDGGIVLSDSLTPTHIGAIVPNRRGNRKDGLGARHNSIISFTESNNCLGIVISEDGPITIYENGIQLLRI
jgi:DNA integrity scanning protein DisA with diadenylate cyclase activity